MMRKTPIYLDNNATTPLRAAAITAMQDAMGPPANPSSVHGFGRNARLIVEMARSAVAMLAGCRAADVVFTSGGTEANNLVMAQYDHVITSAIEHDSVRYAHQDCQQIGVDENGVVDLDRLAKVIAGIDDAAKSRTLVSIMAANNETGVIQPMDEIAAMAESANIALHSDMVQIFGKRHINFATSKISYASLSAHKIGGPSGVGALLVRPGCRLSSLLRGGGQEQGRRAGTENLVGIAGFGGAADDALGDIGHYQTMAKWRDAFESRMLEQRSGVEVFGRAAPRLGNTSCIAAAGKAAETMVMAFDIAGVAISAGSACSSGKVKPSHVLESMGAGPRAGEAIRISGGWATTKSDFETLADVFLQLYKQPA
ncbi:cysteine desulfurase [Alphaproteobacteria bacterium]|nr:cysteine desulfurase [Alphaproteobacteria bacterium]